MPIMFQDKIVVGKIFSKFQKFFDNESEIRCKHTHFFHRLIKLVGLVLVFIIGSIQYIRNTKIVYKT